MYRHSNKLKIYFPYCNIIDGIRDINLQYSSQSNDKWGKIMLGIHVNYPTKDIIFLTDIFNFLQWIMIYAYLFIVPQDVYLVTENSTTQCLIYIPYSHIVKMKIVSTWWECQISQNLCIDNPVNIPIKI